MRNVIIFLVAAGCFSQTTDQGTIKDIQIQTVNGEVKLCVTVDVSGIQPPPGGVIPGHVSISAGSELVFGSQITIEPVPTTQTLCFSLPVECMAHDVGGTQVTFQVTLEFQEGGGGTVTDTGTRTTVIDAGPISPLGVLDFFIKKIDLILSGNPLPQATIDAPTTLNPLRRTRSPKLTRRRQSLDSTFSISMKTV